MAFNHRCSKCTKPFRCTKLREPSCAACHIESEMKNRLEFPHVIDEEFDKLAEEVYGGSDTASRSSVTDVFNHGERLLKIKSNLEITEFPKERNRIGREVDRILEEHNVIQQKILQSQEKMMKIMLFKQVPLSSPQTEASTPVVSSPVRPQTNHQVGPPTPPRQSSTSTTTASVSSLASSSSPVKKFSPVKVHSFSPLTSARNPDKEVASSTKLQIELPVTNIKKAGVIHLPKVDVPDLITPERAEETEDDDDQIAPLKRSNSVRNRIKAFEELNRRASTGAYDNRDSDVSRRKLFQL